MVYRSEDGQLKIDLRLEDENFWLCQQHMAALFQTSKQNISLHLQNNFNEEELNPDSVVKESLTTASDGKRYRTKLYSLDATCFRIWATQKLREHIVKGFVIDDERLKNPDQPFDYFEELLRRIQDIRTSERRFSQMIADIDATSIDYDPTQPESLEFFKTVQNKMHWAVTGQTAAEIIQARADSSKPSMELTNWRDIEPGQPHLDLTPRLEVLQAPVVSPQVRWPVAVAPAGMAPAPGIGALGPHLILHPQGTTALSLTCLRFARGPHRPPQHLQHRANRRAQRRWPDRHGLWWRRLHRSNPGNP